MTYIEQHSNPKILKLGIKWALYDAPIPNIDGFETKNEYDKMYKLWQQSRIAYLKELPFKEGNYVYLLNGENEFRYRIYKVIDESFVELECIEAEEIKTILISKLSHYYPGQEVESFKHVKEIKVSERQDPHQMKTQHGVYESKITVETFEWQEEKKPAERIYTGIGPIKRYDEWENNPEYTQFQEDVDNGTILAEIK